MKKIFVAAVYTLLLMSPAFADQAMVITDDDSRGLVEILREHKTILDYCEPCSNSKRREVTIQSVDRVRFNPNNPNSNEWVVRVNGKKIDLAYTFMKHNGAWENLAAFFNIDVDGVSDSLPLKEKKTKTKKHR